MKVCLLHLVTAHFTQIIVNMTQLTIHLSLVNTPCSLGTPHCSVDVIREIVTFILLAEEPGVEWWRSNTFFLVMIQCKCTLEGGDANICGNQRGSHLHTALHCTALHCLKNKEWSGGEVRHPFVSWPSVMAPPSEVEKKTFRINKLAQEATTKYLQNFVKYHGQSNSNKCPIYPTSYH